MFNANDNKDDLFKNEEKETKPNNEQEFEFKGFSQKQDEVVLDDKAQKPFIPRSDLSFNDFEESPVQEESKDKKRKLSLKEHFKQNRAAQKQLKLEKAAERIEKKPKRVRRRKRKEIEEFDDIKKRRAYKYKRKKYTKVQDFVKYLNEHYLDLDEIAEKVLHDENFHGWIKKRSKRFDESINEFKDIIEIIGN